MEPVPVALALLAGPRGASTKSESFGGRGGARAGAEDGSIPDLMPAEPSLDHQ